MFTGIIEGLGTVAKIANYRGLRCLTIDSGKICAGMKIGDSVALNGVCLTITGIEKKDLSFEMMPTTLSQTTLKDLRLREKVNLERALRSGDPVSGHFVAGHIDGIGIIRSKKILSQNTALEISVDKNLVKYISDKGSIAVDGISLTVGQVRGNVFSVNLIPHTIDNTTLKFKGHSAKVNIEVDMMAKQLAALLRRD
jgi:riboflavin synthase